MDYIIVSDGIIRNYRKWRFCAAIKLYILYRYLTLEGIVKPQKRGNDNCIIRTASTAKTTKKLVPRLCIVVQFLYLYAPCRLLICDVSKLLAAPMYREGEPGTNLLVV